MAAAARCLRSLSRSTNAAKHLSSCLAKNASQTMCQNINVEATETVDVTQRGNGSSRSTLSPLLKSFLSTDSGLLKGTRTVGMSTRINFSKRFAPVSVCSITKACPLSIDASCEGGDALDGNLGDDDGDTWSQGNDDDPYLEDT